MINVTEFDKVIAISNTGPLISSFQCEKTDLLMLYFSLIYITNTELAELDSHGWLNEICKLIDDGFVKVIDDLTEQERELSIDIAKRIASDSDSGDIKWHSHLPEAEAIVLIAHREELMIDIILLDEKSARNIAKELKIVFTGFPGLLVKAGLDGYITQNEIRQLLKICQKCGTHYSDHLIDTIAKTCGR